MNILELDTYSLDDAVKFHDRLNPRIWGRGEQLKPEVAAKLREIAADFQEFLGVDALDIVDITVSGSNAAFSYTPHSDIDLHLVVKMPEANRDVYQELFNAKKYQYNDEHDIKIRGADVELYVQPADENPKSQGIYSLMHNKWLQIPKRRKAEIDDSCVGAKVEDLDARIHSAIKSGDQAHMQSLWNKIKEMRKSGLETNGEFGCENLAFKILRTKGCLKELKTALNAARDAELSMAEQYSQPVIYGYASYIQEEGSTPDGVSASTRMFLSEVGDDEKAKIVQDFITDTAEWLGIENLPEIHIFSDPEWSAKEGTFGRYLPHEHKLEVNIANRHIMDTLRTVAHELAHCKQHEVDPMPDDAGDTGSPWENEAHAIAGIIMRHYADTNPGLFENASGYIPTAREKNDPRYSMALTVDIKPGQVGKEANKLALKTNKQGKPGLLMKTANMIGEGLVGELAQEFALFEEQDLFEVKMSPSNLKREAAKTGAMAGMEFEMIVPNVSVDEEPNYEPDYDQDQRTRSFSDIVNFFYDGDYNGRRDVVRLEEELQDQFGEWLEEQIDEAWASDGLDYLRDYIENNDYFDEEEATEEATNALQAEYGDDISPEDFQKMLDALVKEKFDEFVQDQWDNQGRYYDDALEQFRDEQRQDIDESDWLHEHYPYMTDIQNNFDIAWPYYTDTNEGDGDMDIESVADDFSRAVGMKVNWSSSYHGGRREPNAYVVEPDGSLTPDDSSDGGLEFVSPPMPIDKMIDQLNKVKAWAGDYGCYTNSSTGLHINISVPNYDLDKLDYVKLALLLGDKYILDQYGRSSNTYAKSALGKVQDLIKRDPSKGKELLDKMRGHMEDFATKAIHSGTTDKYTSINTKSGYIEFRSPGGDWLDANFDKIENTLLRFTVALSAAMDPNAYREEYLKKLYKLLEPVAVEQSKDTIKYFADYVAGKTPKAALRSFVKQAQLERKIKRGQTDGKTDYWWRVSNPTHSFGEIEVVAKTKEEAIEKALAPDGYPSWANTRQSVQAVPVRPYDTSPLKATVGEPQPAGGFQWELSQTDIENRLGWPDQTGDANYEVVNRNTLQPVYLFIANTDQDAQRKYGQIIQAMGIPGAAENYGYRARGSVMPPIRQQAVQPSSLRPSNPDGNYVIFSNNSRAGDPPAYRFMAADNDDADIVLLQWSREHPGYWEVHYDANQRLGQPPVPGSTMDLQRQRAAQQQQQQQQPAPGPLGAGRELVGWEIRIDGQPVHTLSGIGNNQGDANRLAQQWILRQDSSFLRQHQGGEVEVVPAWREA